jgi:hypothetical protein
VIDEEKSGCLWRKRSKNLAKIPATAQKRPFFTDKNSVERKKNIPLPICFFVRRDKIAQFFIVQSRCNLVCRRYKYAITPFFSE